MNWKVTWIIMGLRPYCDDGQKKKKKSYSQRKRKNEGRSRVSVVCQGWKTPFIPASEWVEMCSKIIKFAFSSTKKQQGMSLRKARTDRDIRILKFGELFVCLL